MLVRKWTMMIAGTALLALGGVASAQPSMESSATPPSPPAQPAPPEAPTPPDAPSYVDRAEIDRDVAEGMAEARAGLAEARKEIAEAREEIMRQKHMPASARAQALASLDQAERDVANALPRQRD